MALILQLQLPGVIKEGMVESMYNAPIKFRTKRYDESFLFNIYGSFPGSITNMNFRDVEWFGRDELLIRIQPDAEPAGGGAT
jgi:hypothetical protein